MRLSGNMPKRNGRGGTSPKDSQSVCACVRAWVCVCLRVCACARVCVCVRARVCVAGALPDHSDPAVVPHSESFRRTHTPREPRTARAARHRSARARPKWESPSRGRIEPDGRAGPGGRRTCPVRNPCAGVQGDARAHGRAEQLVPRQAREVRQRQQPRNPALRRPTCCKAQGCSHFRPVPT
jgi:hypothetical protein